jgi:hypothetical protein
LAAKNFRENFPNNGELHNEAFDGLDVPVKAESGFVIWVPCFRALVLSSVSGAIARAHNPLLRLNVCTIDPNPTDRQYPK